MKPAAENTSLDCGYIWWTLLAPISQTLIKPSRNQPASTSSGTPYFPSSFNRKFQIICYIFLLSTLVVFQASACARGQGLKRAARVEAQQLPRGKKNCIWGRLCLLGHLASRRPCLSSLLMSRMVWHRHRQWGRRQRERMLARRIKIRYSIVQL